MGSPPGLGADSTRTVRATHGLSRSANFRTRRSRTPGATAEGSLAGNDSFSACDHRPRVATLATGETNCTTSTATWLRNDSMPPRAQPAHIRRDPGLVEDIENELHIAARRDRHIHPPHRGHRTVRHWHFLKHGSPDAHMNVNHDGKDIVVPSATNGSNTSHPRSLKSKGSSTLRKLNGPPTRTFAIRMSLYHLCQHSSTVITVVVGIRVLCIAWCYG